MIIIPRTSKEQNELTNAAREVVNLLTTMTTLNKQNDFTKDDFLTESINKYFINIEHMNYFPLNLYLQTLGCTYEMYKGFSLEKQKKLIKEYINDRHSMYLEHGYTNVILQSMCDSYAHKRNGDTGTRKLRMQTEAQGIKHYDYKGNNYYLNPDKGDKVRFLNIIKDLKISFSYYYEKNAKLPDLFIKIQNKYILVEHKNMKNGGGHQNNVIVEIKDFINEEDNNVYYVSYLDGIAFSQYFEINYNEEKNIKTNITNKNIETIFEIRPRSYIVNPAGFDKLLEELIKDV